jgi:dienelactone hydrolase
MLASMSTITLFALLSIPAWAAARGQQQEIDGPSTPNPIPLINQPLVPDAVRPGFAAFTLTVNGTGFVSSSVVKWNGTSRDTRFVSSSRLTATILSPDVAKVGAASVTVVNPAPGGVSNVVFFPISLPVNLNMSTLAFPAGTGPISVATADFNGDGKLDLVVGDVGNGNVDVLLGKGDGTFQSPVSYEVGNAGTGQAFEFAVGDLNGDGKLDLVVSDVNDDYVRVFLGNGDGTLRPGVTYAVGETQPTAVVVADMNGDGKLDIVTSNQACQPSPCRTATVSVLLGNGDGTFRPHSDYDAGVAANWVMVGDFNRDGNLDLAVVDGQGNSRTSAVMILLGNGDGTFQRPTSYPLSVNGASGATGDFNSDGKLDIAVADNIGLVSILLGNGDGTFQPRVDYTSGSFPWGSFVVGDFNEDNHLDLAVSNFGSNAISVYLGNGDGSFQSPVLVNTRSSPHGVAGGDFNRDGRLDLAVANLNDNTVSILLQDGTVSLSPSSLAFGDQVLGTSSTAKTVTLTNVGAATLTISGIAIAGTNAADFAATNTCGSSLGQNAHCTISVTFAPSQLGPRTAAITFTDSAPDSPQSVPLSGFGVTSGPNATLSATSLTFSTQLVGTSSPPQSVTLSNYGTQALSINNIVANGNFSQSHTCGSSLATFANCTIAVVFKPTQKGSRTGTLSITDNAPNSPQTVDLNGTGTVVKINPTGLAFGVHHVGSTSSQSTTLTNVGSTALSITSIAIEGTDAVEFSQTNTCASSVAAGKSCTITVTFKPSEKGSDSAAIAISDDGGGSPQTVNLSGAGCVWEIINHRRKCLQTIDSAAVRSALTKSRSMAVPSVTGANRVGTRIIDLVDSSRIDPFATNGLNRELVVRFWYPASEEQDCKLADYTSPRVWNYFAELTRLPSPMVTTNSCLNAPVADGEHPVVIFTHGYTGTFTDYTFLVEDLASRGYIVASIDHTYEATAVEFPDERFVKSLVGSHLTNTWQIDDQTLSSALSVRLDDVKFVVDELERLNVSTGNPFTGKLDVTRLALAGHSLGGLTTWFGVQRDARFKAAILLDPYLPDMPLGSTETPAMLLTMGHEQRNDDECELWSDLLGPRFSVNIRGAEHVTPSDLVWLAKGAIKTGAMGPDKTIAAVRDYVATFLDKNLRNRPSDPLLAGPSADYPDAEVKTQGQALCHEP